MQIIKTSHLSMLALAGIFSMAAFGAQAADTAKVNGQVIPQSRFDLLFKQATMRGQKDTPELRNAIRDHLIELEIISQEAENKGLDKNPDVAAALDMQRQQLLIQSFAQDYIKNHPVTEDMLKQEYDRQKAQMANQKEYKVRHIVSKTEQDAKGIIEQLKKGASFEKLAKEKSTDAGTKAQGGYLGDWLPENAPPNQVPAQFTDAVKKLKKGQYTETPVQTQFGWHVIRVDDVRPVTIPNYEAAKPQIKQILENASLKKAVDDLHAKAKIE
jgi:peptidyl-prolyl cis-trans isomerase C